MELKARVSGRAAALAESRRLLRTFGSAPDPRLRAQAVLAELRHDGGWSAEARRRIELADAWLLGRPDVESMEPGLRDLVGELRRLDADG